MTSVILLSAGLDSTVNLAAAAADTDIAATITFDYGQKAASREIERATALSVYYGIPHTVIRLPWLETSASSLTSDIDIPNVAEKDLLDEARMKETAASVWVANRNGVFVNIGASFAEMNGAMQVVAGFNAEEAETFPDNGTEFVAAVNKALALSTGRCVFLKSYTLEMRKSEIVSYGLSINAPLDLVWACYLGGDLMCGRCESCRRYKRACRAAGAGALLNGRFSHAD